MTGEAPAALPPHWAHNRRIMAERMQWPPGVLEVAERITAAHPPWWVSWMPANDIRGWERPAGFWASRRGWHEITLLDPDPEALESAIVLAPEEHAFGEGACWCSWASMVDAQTAYRERIGSTLVMRFDR